MSFYANGASFLAYAVMAEKRGIETTQRGTKSLYFTTGLAEALGTAAGDPIWLTAPGFGELG